MFKNFLRGFTHVLYPLRFLVFVALGSIVLSLTNCVPERGDIGIPERSENPPQKWEKSY